MNLPADLQAALDRLEPAIRAAFLEAIERITSQAQLQVITGHLQAGNIEAAIVAMNLDPRFFGPLDRAIAEAYWQGGVMALAGLPRIPDPFPVAGSSSASTDATRAQKPGRGTIRET